MRDRLELEFPFGRAPGFNPAHPMSRGIRSGKGSVIVPGTGVPGGKQKILYDIVHRGYPASNGVGWSENFGRLGPAVAIAGTGARWTTDIYGVSLIGGTIGFICYPITISQSNNGFVGFGNSVNDFTLLYRSQPDWRLTGNNNFFNSVAPVASIPLNLNTPMFMAVSAGPKGSFWVQRNLSSLALYTYTDTTNTLGTYSGAGTAGVSVGSQGNGAWALGSCYFMAAMYAPHYHSLEELIEWSYRPFEFWYPTPKRIVVKVPVTAKTLTADADSYALTGTDAGLKLARAISASADSYAFTGTDATLELAKKLAAAAGSYLFTGTDAGLRLDRELTVDAGSYSFTGTDATLRVGKTVTADAGSYDLTGAAASLLHQWKVGAGAGSYSISGQDANLSTTFGIVASAGAYSLTGTDAGLTTFGNKLLAAGAGSYDLTGANATLRHAWMASAAAGSYSINGTAASLLRGRKASAAAGAYSFTGIDQSLRRNLPLTAGVGSYTITGNDASLRLLRKVLASPGIYVIDGIAVTLLHAMNYMPVPSERIVAVSAEDRIVEVSAENRIVTVRAENRNVNA